MLIEKINENQIKIILDLNDLIKNNINVHSFMCNSKESKKFFSNILNYVHTQIDFNKIKYEIFAETFFISFNKSFIILITRVPKKMHLQLCINNLKSFKFKHSFWLKFNCLNDFCMFCNSLNFKVNASLYFFNEHYFLHIKPKSLKQYFKILIISCEFSKKIHNNNFSFNGNVKCIIKGNAIQTAKKYFI